MPYSTSNYTPTVNPAGPAGVRNQDLNPLGSEYASNFSQQTKDYVQRMVSPILFDAAPQQFYDLQILSMIERTYVGGDEFEYFEVEFGRKPYEVAANVNTAGSPTTLTVPVTPQTFTATAVDMIVSLPDNRKATVTAKNQGTNEITLTAMTGQTFPNATPYLASGSTIAPHSTVEQDGMDRINNYFRDEPNRRYNFVQFSVRGVRFGKVELAKLKKGEYVPYVNRQKTEAMRQFLVDRQNIIWNGERGEVTLANGGKAKTAGGIYPTMLANGSPSATATATSLPNAVQSLALDTEFGGYGATKFIFGTNDNLLTLSEAYKDAKTRYAPNDMIARLNLDQISLGSTRIVMVPVNIFKSTATYPSAFANRMFLGQMNELKMVEMEGFGLRMGESDEPRTSYLANYKDWWVEESISLEFNNPSSWASIDIM